MSNYQFEQLIWQMQDQVKIDPAKVGAWRDFAHAKVMAGNMGGVFNEQAQI